MWWFIAGLVISFAIALLTPKPKTPDLRPAGIKDFEIPTVSEARNISLLFGKDILSGPNVINYGDLKSVPITVKSGGGLFGGGSKQTVGYMYYLAMDFSLCWGPLDAVHEIRWGDYVAWTGNQTSEGALDIYQPLLFGGKDEQGGVSGSGYFYIGNDTQTSDPYLNSKLGVQPGNRNVAHYVWRGGLVGQSQYIKPVSFIASRYPNPISLSSNKHIIGEDANPACIIAEMYTSKLFGKGYDTSMLDTSSFQTAGNTLYDEGFGLSFIVDSARDCEDVIDEVLRHINASVYVDLSTGKIVLKLIRADYSIATIPELNESTVSDVEDFTRGSIGTIATEVRIVYNERSANYKERVYIQPEIGARHQLGFPKPVSLNYYAIKTKALAAQLGVRELLPLSKTPASCTVICDRNAYDLVPGSVFKLVWSPAEIDQIILRAKEINYGTLENGTIRIACTEDVYALDEALFDENPSSGWVPITGSPLNISDAYFTDMPYWLQQDLSNYRLMVFAPAPRGDHIGFHVWWNDEVTPNTFYQITGNLQALSTIMQNTTDFLEDDVEIEVEFEPNLFPKNVTEDNILTSASNLLLFFNSETGEEELVGYTAYVNNGDGTYTLTGVLRGLVDTTPLRWPSGSFLFPIDGGYGINDAQALSWGGTYDNHYYRLQTRTQSEEYDIDDLGTTEYRYQLTRRVERPWPMGRFYIDGVEFSGDTIKSTDIAFTWAHRSKTLGTLQKQNDATGTKETNVTYTIEIRNEVSTLLRTYSGLTGVSQTYPWATMVSDNGGVAPYYLNVTAFAVDSGVSLSSLHPQQRRIYTNASGPQIIAAQPITSNQGALGGNTWRNIIPASFFFQDATTVRITIKAEASSAIQVDEMWIGHPSGVGDAYDFDGNQVQILFNTGNAGFSIAGGASQDSDDISFNLDHTKPLIVSFYLPASPGNASFDGTISGASNYYKSGNDAATEDATGYTVHTGNRVYLIEKIIDPTL